jgi:hypothetical protein
LVDIDSLIIIVVVIAGESTCAIHSPQELLGIHYLRLRESCKANT